MNIMNMQQQHLNWKLLCVSATAVIPTMAKGDDLLTVFVVAGKNSELSS